MWYLAFFVVALVVAIFFVVSYRDNLKLRAIVFLIIRDKYKALGANHWNEKAQAIFEQGNAEMLRFINQADSDKLQTNASLIIQTAEQHGFVVAKKVELKESASKALSLFARQ